MDNPQPSGKRYQFSLSSLLIATTIVAELLALGTTFGVTATLICLLPTALALWVFYLTVLSEKSPKRLDAFVMGAGFGVFLSLVSVATGSHGDLTEPLVYIVAAPILLLGRVTSFFFVLPDIAGIVSLFGGCLVLYGLYAILLACPPKRLSRCIVGLMILTLHTFSAVLIHWLGFSD